VLIVERGIPIARLEPAHAGDDPAGRLERLERAGLLKRGTRKLPDDFFDRPLPKASKSVVEAVLEERREGR
jgi:hypothetical protein